VRLSSCTFARSITRSTALSVQDTCTDDRSLCCHSLCSSDIEKLIFNLKPANILIIQPANFV
jgi:hypothetical protein